MSGLKVELIQAYNFGTECVGSIGKMATKYIRKIVANSVGLRLFILFN